MEKPPKYDFVYGKENDPRLGKFSFSPVNRTTLFLQQ